jgi:hypothetical protein
MIRKWVAHSLGVLAAAAFLSACHLDVRAISKTLLLIGMASGIGQTHANSLITSDFQNSAYTGPATLYLAVFTAAPSDTGVGTEVTTSGTAYARIAITCNNTNFTPVSAGTVLLATSQTYAQATANYGTVTDAAFMAASSGGTQPYYWGDLNASVVINTGNTLSFPANSVEVAYV